MRAARRRRETPLSGAGGGRCRLDGRSGKVCRRRVLLGLSVCLERRARARRRGGRRRAPARMDREREQPLAHLRARGVRRPSASGGARGVGGALRAWILRKQHIPVRARRGTGGRTDLNDLGEAERIRPERLQPAAAQRRGGAGSLARPARCEKRQGCAPREATRGRRPPRALGRVRWGGGRCTDRRVRRRARASPGRGRRRSTRAPTAPGPHPDGRMGRVLGQVRARRCRRCAWRRLWSSTDVPSSPTGGDSRVLPPFKEV